jgi:hypothetical protein
MTMRTCTTFVLCSQYVLSNDPVLACFDPWWPGLKYAAARFALRNWHPLATYHFPRDDDFIAVEVEMKILVVALSSAFLAATIVTSFSSEAYAARRGTMSGVDNTYSSQKGQKCQGGACTPGAPKKKK